MILALDISSKCTGWAKFTKDGKLSAKGRIVPDPKIHPYLRLHFVATEAEKLFGGIDELVIEGLYLGINPKTVIYLAKIQGAVGAKWISQKYKIYHTIIATSARARIGINGRAHKAEVQLEILQKYGFTGKKKINEYRTYIDGLKATYKAKKLKKGAFKYRLDKLSKLIDQETGIGEDIADSIVVGLAYLKGDKL